MNIQKRVRYQGECVLCGAKYDAEFASKVEEEINNCVAKGVYNFKFKVGDMLKLGGFDTLPKTGVVVHTRLEEKTHSPIYLVRSDTPESKIHKWDAASLDTYAAIQSTKPSN